MTNDGDARTYALTPAQGVAAEEPPLDERGEAALQAGLYRLLEKRVRYMTMGDSTSVRAETAEELLKSIIYALELYARESGLPRSALLARDICDVYDDAIDVLEREKARAKALYERALAYVPPVGNRSYNDTLKGLGLFFRRYDPRVMAHDIPCDIDYQLCIPVDERLQGVSYVLEYLQRLLYEQAFLARLDGERVKRLLYKYCPDPAEQLINLCEPAIVNAIGASMAGLSVSRLEVPASAGARLAKTIANTDAATVGAKAERASEAVCDALALCEACCRDYVEYVARALCPRLTAAAQNGDLSRVFIDI